MLVHYIFVRRDLPLGVICAQITHAAGESAHLYQDENGRFRGATAVVLEAKDQKHLKNIRNYLMDEDIQYIQVIESSEPYANQLMALGLVPTERTPLLSAKLGEYQTLKTCIDKVEYEE